MADEHEEHKDGVEEQQEKSPNLASSKKTIFVRNLPFDTTNKQLEEIFSDDAPIKQAFVVRDKDNRSKCRGFGYVEFVLQDDAEKALNASKSFKKRKLLLCYANKKPKHEKRKRKEIKNENDNGKEELTAENVNTKHESETMENSKENLSHVSSNTAKISNKKLNLKQESKAKMLNQNNSTKWTSKTEVQRTVVVGGLTNEVNLKDLKKFCAKFGKVENIEFPVKDRSEPTAFVRYIDYRNAIRAVQKIPGMKVKKSNVLSTVLLTKEDQRPSKRMLEKARLIIRNLSFKCEESELMEAFSKYGKVFNVHIPTKIVNGNTVNTGFAFVQFNNPANSKVAMEDMNMKEIKGRKVVVDWAVGKEEYGAEKNKMGSEKNMEKTKNPDTSKGKENDSDDSEGSDEEDGEEENQESEEDTGDGEENDIEGNSASEEESDAHEEVEEASVSEGNHDYAENKEIEDDSDPDEENDDEEEGSDIDEEREARIKAKLKDAKEGKTVFVRNLSYNTEDDMLEEEFEKYGEIDYCIIVYDKETGHSKGCAFVKFKEKESADNCIEDIEKLIAADSALKIDGRSVIVSRAVTRGKIEELERSKSSEKKETDRRNLYLAYEGVITSKSPGADSLSEADLRKREKALAEKKSKLKNPQYFVSRTRLCVRNLPLSCDTNELREKFFGELGDETSDIKVTDIKIARNKERKDTSGQSRSLGYGFIELNTHEGALKLLRATNNNPDIFGPERRPIVEFSVENSKALKILDLKRQKIARLKFNAAGEENSIRNGDGRRPRGPVSDNNNRDFNDDDKRKEYKLKAKEHRYKRQLRYQKRREERRKARALKGEATIEELQNNTRNLKPLQKEPKHQSKRNQKQTGNKSQKVTKTSVDESATRTLHNKTKDQKQQKFSDKTESMEAAFMESRKRRMLDTGINIDRKMKRAKENKADEAKFTSLVAQYKNKLNSSVGKGKKKNAQGRWFE